jgi:hypothetical protein
MKSPAASNWSRGSKVPTPRKRNTKPTRNEDCPYSASEWRGITNQVSNAYQSPLMRRDLVLAAEILHDLLLAAIRNRTDHSRKLVADFVQRLSKSSYGFRIARYLREIDLHRGNKLECKRLPLKRLSDPRQEK